MFIFNNRHPLSQDADYYLLFQDADHYFSSSFRFDYHFLSFFLSFGDPCHDKDPLVFVSRSFVLCLLTWRLLLAVGYSRLIGCLILHVMFRESATNCRALLQKTTCEDKASYDSWQHVCCWQLDIRADTHTHTQTHTHIQTRTHAVEYSSSWSSPSMPQIFLILCREVLFCFCWHYVCCWQLAIRTVGARLVCRFNRLQ